MASNDLSCCAKVVATKCQILYLCYTLAFFFFKIIHCRVCPKRVSCKGGSFTGVSGERHVSNFFVCLNLGMYVKKCESEEFKLKIKIKRNLN